MNVWDFIDWAEGLNKGADIIDLIFNILTVIVMFLCFFSLTSTMTGNILQNRQEIAVLRSIGMTKR